MLSRATQAKLAVYFCGMIALHGSVLWHSRSSIVEGAPDFSIFYTAGRIVMDGNGHRLYDDAVQEPVQRSFAPVAVHGRGAILPYNHLPFEALIFAPLAHFSFVTAYVSWLTINLALLCATAILLQRHLTALRIAPLYLWLLAVFAFYPVFMALIQGQDSIPLLFLYCLAYASLERGSDLAAGSGLALGLFKYHLVVPFVVPLWRRNRVITGFLAAAAGLGLISLAITGGQGLLGYPRYVWGTEHDPKYVLSSLQGQTANLRGLISGIFADPKSVIGTGLVVLFSAIVLLAMMYASARTSWTNSEGRHALLALNIVGTVLVSYHIFVHDMSVLFLAMVLVLEILLSGRSIPNWMKRALWACLATLSLSPLYVTLSLRYHQLQWMAIVLGALFITLMSVIGFLAANPGEAKSPRASEGR
jgi:hypothetical protein